MAPRSRQQRGDVPEDTGKQKVNTLAPKMVVQPPRIWPWEAPWISRSSHKHGRACRCAYFARNCGSQLLGKEINVTVEYLEDPEVFDHSCLRHLKRVTISRGLDPSIFGYVVLPGEDNGEVILSKYYKKQQNRNSAAGQDAVIAAIVENTYHPS